jgi:hypothetical protein
MRCKTSRDIYETITQCVYTRIKAHTHQHTHTHIPTHTYKQDCAQCMCASILSSNDTPNRRKISPLNCPCFSVFMQKDHVHAKIGHRSVAEISSTCGKTTRHSLLGVNTKILLPLSYHPSIRSSSSSSSPMLCAAVALSLCSAGVIHIRRGSYK